MSIDALSALVTKRTVDLFDEDLVSCQLELEERIGGSRILVIGGAGSIGGATVRLLSEYRPHALHVVDLNENSLVELIRDLRSSNLRLPVIDFKALPLDFGSPVMHRFLRESVNRSYDFIFNFAAHKHVRSEKNVPSLLQMLDTNVVKAARFIRWLSERQLAKRYFCVSTDKAANPVNLMGASKRIMEHVIFSGEAVRSFRADIVSSRFANVAFSNGSLLESFLIRIQKRQPIAVPRETRRYFISLREAAQICVLAGVCAPHRHILIPKLDPAEELQELVSIAVVVLGYYGFEPRFYSDEMEAKHNCQPDIESGYYPVLLTPLDTTGEKPYEEFVADGETVVDVGMARLLGVQYKPSVSGATAAFIDQVEEWIANPVIEVQKEDIIQWMSRVVPELRHIETGKNLDERM